MRILLVEDNADHRELMSLALTGHDSTWEVEGVESGEKALCLLLGGEVFDLVFLDYSLPQRDGLWFLGEIRRGKASPPVVMVTGRGDEGVAVEAMKRGAYDYVVKQEGYLERLPVAARHAMEANRMALERKQAEEALRESEERFSVFMDYLPASVFIKDHESRLLYVNQYTKDFYGMVDMLGKQVIEVLPREIKEAMISDDKKALSEGPLLMIESVPDSKGVEHIFETYKFSIKREGKPTLLGGIAIDITERKRAEEKLRRAEENFRRSLDDSPLGVRIVTTEGETVYANRAILEIYGYDSIEELRKTPTKDRYTPESYAEFQIRKKKRQQGEYDPPEYEISIVRKNGEVRHLQVFRKEVLWNGERQFQTIYHDITERKRAEVALRRSEERFRASVENFLEGFAILSSIRDSDGQLIDFRYEYINEAGCKMNQKAREEHIGRTLLKLFPEEKEIGLFDDYVEVIETGQPLVKEHVIYEPVYGGSDRLKQAFDVQIIRLEDGIVVSWQDITEKKRREELLRQSEERLKRLIENSKDIIVMADLEGEVLYYNGPPGYGVRTEDVLGKNAFSIFEPVIAARLMNQLRQVVKEKEALTIENFISRRGEPFWFSTHMYPIQDEQNRMYAVGVIARNITERKRAEEEVWRYNEELTALNAIAIMVNSSLDLQQILDQTLDKVLEITKMEIGSLYLTDPQTEELVLSTYKGVSKEFADQVRTFKFGESIVGLAAQSGKPIVADDLTGDPRVTTTLVSGEGIRSLAAIPMKSKNKVQGMINMASYTCHSFTNEEIDFYTAIANQIGVAIENARLYEAVQRELTERKQAEEALRESEERWKSLTENSPDHIMLLDLDGTILFINRTVPDLTKEEVIGTSNFKYMPPEHHQIMADCLKRVLASGRSDMYTTVYHTKEGGVRFFDVRIGPVFKNGQVVAFVSSSTDVTERKRAEEALRESEERYRNLVESISDVIYAINSSGVLTYISPVVKNTLGYEPDELIGRQFLEFVHKEDHDLLMRRLSELREGIVRDSDYRVIGKHGDIKWVRTLTNPIIEEGGFVGARGVLIDITERKLTEEKLQKSERLLRAFMSAIKESAFMVDTEGIVIISNETLAQRLGTNVNEIIGTCIYNYFPREIARARKAEVDKVIRTGKPSRYEDRRAGLWIDSFVYPIFDEEGKVVNVGVIAVDITERKQAEEALIKSELRFRNCFDLPLIGFAITSPEKGWIEVNDRICSILGYSRDEIVQRTWSELTHPDDLAADIEQFNLVLSGQIEKYSMDKRFIRKDGQVVWTSISVGCVRKPDGRVDYIIGLMEDTTERKRIEEALKKSETLHKEAQKTAHIGHWGLDTSIMVPTWSEEIFRIFGLDPQKDPPSFAAHQKVTHPDDWNILNNAVTRSINEGIPFNIDFRILRPDKTIRWMHAIGYPKRDSEGRILSVFGTAQDVTESKQAEDQIRSSEDQMRSLSARLQDIREEERTLMAREIHDELGQELTGLKMDLSWLIRRLSKNQKSLISKTESMLKLVDSTIQTVRRISSELRPGVLDDLGLIAAIEWQAQDFENRTGITCDFSSSVEEIDLDRDRSTAVFRIFEETLTNVFRHAKATRVKISLEESVDSLILRIDDNGKGIKESEVSHPESLGLLGMRERVLVFGGEVEISGIPKKGTTVTVTIPIKKE